MLVITIISDWGDCSYYLPMLKGKLYSLLKKSNNVVIDSISNTVPSFNIIQGCFLLKNSFKNYPNGSIHLMGINSEVIEGVDMVAVKYDNHWIVAPNDGRFSLIIGANDIENGLAIAYRVPICDFSTYMACDQFVKAVDLIISGEIYKELNQTNIKISGGGLPTMLHDRIIGKVIYVDSYGNVITNISKEIFLKLCKIWVAQNNKDPYLVIYINGPHLKIQEIVNGYNDVNIGENLALFNSLNLLEFAINNGNFSKIEGVDINSEIMIKLY